MSLDLSSLKKALDSYRRAIDVASSTSIQTSEDNNLKETIRAGVIQNFEFTFEMCWKFMQRWLRENQNKEEAEFPRTRKELFRTAARYGLIKDPLPWFEYGDSRNLTSHTYNDEKAQLVYQSAMNFIVEARYLLDQLEKRND